MRAPGRLPGHKQDMDHFLDTSWIIQALAGRPETIGFHKHLNLACTALSIISIGEIYEVAFAYANPQEHLASFRQFLSPFRLLTLNEPIMEQFGEIRARFAGAEKSF